MALPALPRPPGEDGNTDFITSPATHLHRGDYKQIFLVGCFCSGLSEAILKLLWMFYELSTLGNM